MSLHLVRMGVNLRALATYAAANRLSDDDGGYALHCALRARFGTAAPQPFRLFGDHAAPHLLGYATEAQPLADAAALPSPDPLLAHLFDPPAVQAMPATWRSGARYGFEVRGRPVVRFGARRRDARAASPGAWQPRASEIDAFVAACERAGDGVPVDREAVYRDWLAARLERAAVLERAELRALQRTRTRRSRHEGRGTAPVEGPDVVFAGTLAIGDPDAFARVLSRGIGRHTAFGFGMLLLSPLRPGD